VQPQGPIWPRSSARAKTVKLGLDGVAVACEPLDPFPGVFTSLLLQDAEARIRATTANCLNMQCI